ncbi:hypothetical protein B0H16DRAFT_1696210 [Mycena metata]|uniref:Uncharacterized protein n=1 Tax=Mycena metata TaxID=1033252 RepID=A0AAD7I3P4_9AGAR|nr:hypothetical protein B0H16DRAFT_1696210 [Mycena metata]
MSSSDPPPVYTAAPRQFTPNYAAAAGGEDLNLEEYTGTFYAVITDDWQGFCISKYPRATTWSAEGWSSFQTRWYSTPPSSPSSTILSVSRSPSPASISPSSPPSAWSPLPSTPPSPLSPSPLASPAASPAELSASPSPVPERTIVYRGTFPTWLARTSAVVYEHQQLLTAYVRECGGVDPELINRLPPEHRQVVEAYAETLHPSVAVKSNTKELDEVYTPIYPTSTTNNSECFVVCVRGNGSGVSTLSLNSNGNPSEKPYPNPRNTYSVIENEVGRKRRTGSSTRRFQVTARLAQHKAIPSLIMTGSSTSGIQVVADWLKHKANPGHYTQLQAMPGIFHVRFKWEQAPEVPEAPNISLSSVAIYNVLPMSHVFDNGLVSTEFLKLTAQNVCSNSHLINAYPGDPPRLEPVDWPTPPFHSAAHNRLCQADDPSLASLPADAYEGFMFAVKGHPRILLDRDSAIALLKLTPGGELFFSRDEREGSNGHGHGPLRYVASFLAGHGHDEACCLEIIVTWCKKSGKNSKE